ncbi:hypothetical protein F4780DRAFT_729786 [Xylariomycetidae sp. FL0641]|nr:hypothetical protein F4780DRAFT_729786 [Xylariomycetidae sp. FL0641]
MCMWPSIVPAGAQVTAAVHCAEKPSVPVTTATTTTTKVQQPEQDEYEPQVDDIAGPAMQWWPEPEPAPRRAADCWAVERAQWARRAQGHGLVRPVDDIEGALMSWWPAPAEMLVRREWDERFYE